MSLQEPATNESQSSPDDATTSQAAGSPASHSAWKRWAWRLAGGAVVLLLATIVAGTFWFFSRYRVAERMDVEITEYTSFEYPANPGAPSLRLGEYDGRRLELVQTGDRTFDFIFHADQEHVAEVVFRDVDVSLMTPGLPEYAKPHDGLKEIALVDRQWNRQQVQFPLPSPHVEISGGDGFEQEHAVQASLAKNCLNAGLWEVILYDDSAGDKRAYYHGWFTFPMGQYKRLWEQNTGLSYWENWNWYRMEHWLDPAGAQVDLAALRTVREEQEPDIQYDAQEAVIVSGEQVAKKRTLRATNVTTWGDFNKRSGAVRFASFVPPGYYDVQTPWENEYWRIAELDNAVVRKIDSPAGDQGLHEIELQFNSDLDNHADGPAVHRFFVGGVDLGELPRLATSDYQAGLYMPMGIGVPPFYQTYDKLLANPPQASPYYSFLLDGDHRWIDHHSTAIDGPVMHWDNQDSRILHLCLLSYERHSLVRHFQIIFDEPIVPQPEAVAAKAKEPVR